MIKNIEIFLIIFFFIFAATLGNNYGKNKAENLCKQQLIDSKNLQLKITNEIINDKKQTEQRKNANRKISSNDNLEWLRSKRCLDCKK